MAACAAEPTITVVPARKFVPDSVTVVGDAVPARTVSGEIPEIVGTA